VKKLFLVSLYVLGVLSVMAQDTTIQLSEIVITKSRFTQFSTGSKVQFPDSVLAITYRTQSLSELLSSQSQIFIKSYGQGLATASFRGTAAEHTAVLWKGFNLQNPLFGQVDFSVIATDIADQVSIQYGANSALFGSGAIGGVVQLQSTPHFNSGLHASVGVQVGSFSHLRKQVSLSYGSPKWYATIKWFQLSAQNNFSYTNTFLPNSPKVKQTNAAVAQQSFVNEHTIKLTANQEISLNFWYQYADRQIPPTMSSPQSSAFQTDESYRATVDWKLQQKKITWMARTAYFNDQLNYTNPISTLLDGNSLAQSSITEVESRIQLMPNHYLNIGVNNTYVKAFSTGYNGTFNQNRTAVFVSYKLQSKSGNFAASTSIRKELVENTWVPFMPTVGAEWQLLKGVKVMGTISRSYRLPTFNELYWRSVQTQLQPETGWGEEMSIILSKKYHKWDGSFTLTGFNRNIENWIVWQPASTDWAPQNVKKVNSKGAELNANISYAFSKCKVSYQGMFNYVSSTNTETTGNNTEIIGKQLLYVPRITHQHQVLAAFLSWHLGVLYNYTGMVYTSTDNANWLRDYGIATVVGGKQFTIKKYAIIITAQLNNVLNTTYQSIADRPMPLQNFLLNTTFKF
jgi:iron complex outermembrane receptor protein